MCHSISGSAQRFGDLNRKHGLTGPGFALHQQRTLKRDRRIDCHLEVVGGDVGAGTFETHEKNSLML